MWIEALAQRSPWRTVCPFAKAGFALTAGGLAFAGTAPLRVLSVAGVLSLLSVWGAGTPWRAYGRVAAPGLAFLLLSSLTLLVSVQTDAMGALHLVWLPEGGLRLAELGARALAALAALLFLVLSTPLPDLLGMLRRLRVPASLLDLMVLCYRMLFVFAAAWQAVRTAQQARLGGVSLRARWRGLQLITASLAVQVWLRAQALERAAAMRLGEGRLRFLLPVYPTARRDRLLAFAASLALVVMIGWGA